MNDLIRPSLYDAYHPILPARKRKGKHVILDVVGPICESGDFFAQDRSMPWPDPGDLWAITFAGAYGFSMSSQYNFRPRPAEAWVEGSRFRLIRKREDWKDITQNEIH